MDGPSFIISISNITYFHPFYIAVSQSNLLEVAQAKARVVITQPFQPLIPPMCRAC